GGANPALTPSSGFTSGGSFTASPAGLTINSTTGAIDVAASTPGTYTVTYTLNASGCNSGGSGQATITISSSITPVTGFAYSAISACTNGSNPIISYDGGFTTGGTFTATPAGLSINATTGAIDIAASTAGDYTITYTVAANGCSTEGSSQAIFSIYTNTLPITGFRYLPATVCEGGSNPVMDKDLAYTSGGVYSAQPAGLSLNTLTGNINVAASIPGNYKIYYSLAASGCTLAGFDSTTFTITAVTTPVTTFSYTPNSVCANGSNPVLNPSNGFTAGGTFSSTAGLIIDATTGAINVGASTPGTYNITYTVAANGCAAGNTGSSSFTIIATTSPVVGFSYTPNSTCATGSISLQTGTGFTTGGVFSAPAGLSLNPNTGAINPATSTTGNYTVTYSVAASGCQLADAGTASVSITGLVPPVTDFSYSPAAVCVGAANPVLVAGSGFTGGGIFTASPSGLSINSISGAINVAASTPGNYTITYSVAASGCTDAGSSGTSFTITAAGSPAIGFSYDVSSVCTNGNAPVITVEPDFTTGGNFTATPQGLNINNTTGAITLAGSIPGSYNITYSVAASGCVQAGVSSPFLLTVNSTPAPPSAANGKNCGPGVVALTATGSGTIRWYDDAALTSLVHTGNVYTPNLTATTVYRLTATTGNCSSNPSVVTATIGTIPQPPFLGNDTAICEGDILLLDAGVFANYTWQDGTSTRTYTVRGPGQYSVTVGNSDGCTAGSSINISTEAECSDIYFPSAFAPDGKNKFFGPISPTGNVSGITRYSLTVYNRYGQIVFISTNPAEKWDGSFKGKKQGTQAFVW
ncbi:MAG TPA: gliding motility-associated C-terminal domain-containing protein, partial [Ferruginibacter sp.]|nr:gliding motility-associated C-terminal domain-containing protein [Ferruginibacter sp.]HMP22473.1 gliding motility-associated C-terminal domain-containing protein [Ferruginibacter sp.]